jgi:multiple sugar transport system substrate-binding protein
MTRRGLALAAVISLVLAACAGGATTTTAAGEVTTTAAGGGATTTAGGTTETTTGASGSIKYSLWDANQLPAYQACEAAFEAANPAIDVTVEQLGWDDYWNGITTGLVSGTAPDVFTDHLAKYPEFANTNSILPLNDYIQRDGLATDIYFPGLADLWTTPDGSVYGLPKDWDTIAFAFNKEQLGDAAVDEASLASLDWNPQDGGSFEQLIAHLTIDANGVRGDEAGFDKSNVAVYGLGLENSGGGYGQTQWSFWAVTNGWTFMNQPFWGTAFNYNDPKFIETITWWKGLVDKGYMPTLEAASGIGYVDQFKAGIYSTISAGSWQIGDIVKAEFPTGFFPTPIGPTGKRASMFNGLADSISASSKNPDAAWEWVKFLASPDCQNLVADTAVVFPAVPAAADRVKQLRAEQGVDVSAYTVHVEEGTTFTFPIADHASDASAIMSAAMDAVMSGQGDPTEILTQANEEVNALFQ